MLVGSAKSSAEYVHAGNEEFLSSSWKVRGWTSELKSFLFNQFYFV